MRILRAYVKFMDTLTEWLGVAAQLLVILVVFLGFANVVLRYTGQFIGLRLTSNVVIELQWYIYSLIFFFGFSYILKHNINVRVDFWYANQTAKLKAWINVVGHFVALLPFALLGVWVTVSPVLKSWGLRPDGSWGTWEMSPDPSGLPRAPIKTMIIVAFALLLLQGIAEVIKYVAVLREDADLYPVELAEASEAPIRIE